MPPIRVLVVDDSAVVRRQVAQWLEAEPGMEIVATARDGGEAIERVGDRNPDIVLLDVEMPGVDGLEALREIRQRAPNLPVVMFSALTPRGGQVTLDALSLGATDYVLKPTAAGDARVSADEARRQLVEKITRLHDRAVAIPRPPAWTPSAPSGRTPAPQRRVDVVAIGSSTGGPTVLDTIFRALPKDLSAPILIVQHMPPVFTRSLADRLTRISGYQVEEARDGAVPKAGTAWVAPGGSHLVCARQGTSVVLKTNEDPPENSCRPSVDVLFRSVAAVYGPHALGVVLTGMGQDGAAGARRMADEGATILAQDETSSVVWGMPGAVVAAGAASHVLPADEIAGAIERIVRDAEGVR